MHSAFKTYSGFTLKRAQNTLRFQKAPKTHFKTPKARLRFQNVFKTRSNHDPSKYPQNTLLLKTRSNTAPFSKRAQNTLRLQKRVQNTLSAFKSAPKTPSAFKNTPKTPSAFKSAPKTPTAFKSAPKTPSILETLETRSILKTLKTRSIFKTRSKHQNVPRNTPCFQNAP
ncbi:hypothetical protein BC938DRAFT_476998 [Jimgerdemannia flammicorona]|uniref:Uncharacterized protein n=1 Tax=Jimgerdemannia flammicorona TaxID=994334 RepID=A0A433QPY6_9FUNG|nr:hypothetical protein BC938DRAFT_476998 [Jimgerdemannia flammicorona]